MLLSGDDEQLLNGNFMGDFVKGSLHDRFPVRIGQGITLHRRIDSFAGRNELFQQSRRRIDPHYGLYRGVMVDLFYDHILVKKWNNWSGEPFNEYLDRCKAIIMQSRKELPEQLQKLVPHIFEELLPSYGEVRGICKALERMSRRVTRTNPLAGGEVELERHYDGLLADFGDFLPMVSSFVTEELAKSCDVKSERIRNVDV